MWAGQYLNFRCHFPIRCECGLVRTLYNGAQRICSPKIIDTELKMEEKILQLSGYSLRFVQMYNNIRAPIIPSQTTGKNLSKSLYCSQVTM